MTARPNAPEPVPASASATPARPPLTVKAVDQRLAQWQAKREYAEALAWLDQLAAELPRPSVPLELRRVRLALAARQLEPACAAAQRVLAAGAADSWCHLALAMAARRDKRWDDALQALEQGLQRPGTNAELYLEQGEVLLQLGRHEAAARALEAALNLMPHHLRAARGLAMAVAALGEGERAARIVEQMVARSPDTADGRFALGNALRELQLLPQALQAYERAAALDPARPGVWVNRGAVLRKLGRSEEALGAYAQAMALQPDAAAPYYNRANLLRALERMDEALQDYERALAIAPQDGLVRWNKALCLLAMGRLAEGFAEYEGRWQSPEFPTRPRSFAQPAWDGGTLAGQTLLVHQEQGQGDVIQFLRFVPALVALGARVVLEVHAPLKPLVAAQAWPGVTVVAGGAEPLPGFDLHVAIGSLPHRLGGVLDTLSGAPYLQVPVQGVAAAPGSPLARLLQQAPDPGRLRAGLVWAGNPGSSGDRERSMRFAQVQPLLDVPGVDWYGLQEGHAEDQVPAGAALTPLGPNLADWAATAQAMQALDLVLTTCTATAHLAGALGKPVWVLLAHEADWRWMNRARTGSPWYASARLFRQAQPGDWAGVMQRVHGALLAQVGQQPA
jgi:tetratricopeptide (TPR) repeat protein